MPTHKISFLLVIRKITKAALLVAVVLFFHNAITQAQTVVKWEGPSKDNQGWDYWKGIMSDGSTMWVWDNSQGERKFAYDTNNDGRYESWQEEFSIPGQKVLLVHHWDINQDSKDEGIAWCEGGVWIEKVWDSNNDGLFDSWCMYNAPGCVQYQSATKDSYSLVEKKNALDVAYRDYIAAQKSNSAPQKRAENLYQRANLIYNICMGIEMR